MKISEILKKRNEGVSFEYFPPRTEQGKKSFLETIEALKVYNPLYVSMTCGAGGSGAWDRTEGAVDLLLEKTKWVVMPHVTCMGIRREEVKGLLDRYQEKGIENLMVLRGDPPRDGTPFDPSIREFRYAVDLVSFVKEYGHFCMGVAVYPEGHLETGSLKEDLEHAKAKIDRGADFAITQMFFDNTYYYRMLDRMKKEGITIPVLPGILPLADVAKVKQFASICRATIPKEIEEKMERLKANPAEMEKAGLDFTIRQCRDLLKNGIRRVHFYTLNKFQVTKTVLDAIL